MSVAHNTFTIERTFAASPERVFAMFSDPAQKQRWYGQSENHAVEKFEMDFRAGGKESLHYRFGEKSPFPGVPLTNEHTFLEIVPGARIVASAGMAIGGRFISGSLETFEFEAADGGTKMIFTHQGAFLEGSGGWEMRKQGWETLFDKLTAAIG